MNYLEDFIMFKKKLIFYTSSLSTHFMQKMIDSLNETKLEKEVQLNYKFLELSLFSLDFNNDFPLVVNSITQYLENENLRIHLSKEFLKFFEEYMNIFYNLNSNQKD